MTPEFAVRKNRYEQRAIAQRKKLNLPIFPTTTIGSFPQTKEIRSIRQDFKSGKISEELYVQKIRKEIAEVIKKQEELDIDVLVHGESERNDMVEYFGELLRRFCLYQKWLGTKLWFPLRKTAYYLWRCIQTGTHDG